MIEPGWHPLALSRDIEAGTSAGAVLDGEEIVIWRDASGVIHAWEDRCPHRGMKLSFGFVRGDHIACLYHGWQYDHDGRCQYIPAHPKLEPPKTICVATFPVAEAGGMVHVWRPSGVAPLRMAAVPHAAGVRSLWVDVPLDHVLSALAQGFGATGPLYLENLIVRLPTPLSPLVIGLHPVLPHRTALHIACEGEPPPQVLCAVAARAEAFRRGVETAGAGAAA